jgi:hypothetical protein
LESTLPLEKSTKSSPKIGTVSSFHTFLSRSN